MSPEDKASGWIAGLSGKLSEDLNAAEEQVAIVHQEMGGGEVSPSRALMALISVCIDRSYTGVEAALVRIARGVDGVLPTGDAWHLALLHQMTLPIQDRRPAVLRPETSVALDALRRHRHWLRHSYAAAFEWSRMETVARALPAAIAAARQDIDQFIAFLGAQP